MNKQARIGVAIGLAFCSALVGLWVTSARVEQGESGTVHSGPTDLRAHAKDSATSKPSVAGSASNASNATPGGIPLHKAPFDVGAVIEQARSSFEATDDGFRGGRATYAVRATSQGVGLKARHWARADAGDPREPGDALESDELVLPTAHVGRDGVAASTSNAEAPGLAEKAQLVTWVRPSHTERLRQSPEGVEQSWAFDAMPAGRGDLTVRVDVSGLTYTGENAEGLHFADARGLGFRYGNGTWVDAAGTKTAVKAHYADGAIALVVPRDVVERSVYPAVLDPIVSPEFGLEPVLGPARNNQVRPSVASNGTSYLVAWVDHRGGGFQLFATRVSASGEVFDGAGIEVATEPSFGKIGVASNGSDYLVVWDDYFEDIYARRVNAAGVLQDGAALVVSKGAGSQTAPSVASNGTDYLVAWQDNRTAEQWDVYANRVTAAGVVQDGGGFVVSSATGAQAAPSVASDGAGYLVAWGDSRSGNGDDIYASRVSASGVVQDATGISVSAAPGSQDYPSVASNGLDYLVAWQDGRGSTRDIYASRVSAAGVVQDNAGFAVSTAAGNQERPSVASNGSDYLVGWLDHRRGGDLWDVYVGRVTVEGEVGPVDGLLVSTMAEELDTSNDPWGGPTIASDGANYLVGWMGLRAGNWDIYVSPVDADDFVVQSTGVVASLSVNEQAGAVASNGSGFLVVWSENRSGRGADIFASRVSGSGVVEDPVGLLVSAAAGSQAGASVASNGTDYLVTWSDGRAGGTDIYAARVTGGGVVLDPMGLPVTTGKVQLSPSSVASDGANYLVVWSQGAWGASDIYASRVSASGVIEDVDGIAVSTASDDQYSPSVASNGSGYLVAWQDSRGGLSGIYAARVSLQGVVADASGVLVAQDNGPREDPSVASNGESYLVAWEDRRNNNWDVFASRVSALGIVEDPEGLAVAALEEVAERNVAASSNGSSYLLTWYNGAWDESSLRAASLVFDPELELSEFTIDGSSDLPRNSRIAVLGGRYLVSYAERESFIPRLHLRLITPDCSSDPLGDADADGVCDSIDNCPDVASFDEKDSDGDSVGDACDACPNDASKVEVGQCGCGVPDTDADDDGTADCDDGCPTDVNKLTAGVCGCGIAESACLSPGEGGAGGLDGLGGELNATGGRGNGTGASSSSGGASAGGTASSGGNLPDVLGGAPGAADGDDSGDSGCGCRVAGKSPRSPAALLAFAAGIGLIVTRRRLRAA